MPSVCSRKTSWRSHCPSRRRLCACHRTRAVVDHCSENETGRRKSWICTEANTLEENFSSFNESDCLPQQLPWQPSRREVMQQEVQRLSKFQGLHLSLPTGHAPQPLHRGALATLRPPPSSFQHHLPVGLSREDTTLLLCPVKRLSFQALRSRSSQNPTAA